MPSSLETEQKLMDYLAHVGADGKANAEKICEHFISLGYPITNTIIPAAQLIACGAQGCTYRVGPNIVLKVTESFKGEISMLQLLSDAGLIGHPAYPVLTPTNEIYCQRVSGIQSILGSQMCSYLLKEIIPLTNLLQDLDDDEWDYIAGGLSGLDSAANLIDFGLESDPEVAQEGLQRLYRLGEDPMLGQLADFLLQAALSNLLVSADMTPANVGLAIGRNGQPLFEEGLVIYDLQGGLIRSLPGLGLYADYVLDENLGV